MKITEKHKREIEEVVVVDIFCNQCGNSLKTEFGYEGIVEYGFIGGYASKLGDGDEYQFSLCEACLKELFLKFKHNPHQGNRYFDEDLIDS